jgi:O-antigen ligase
MSAQAPAALRSVELDGSAILILGLATVPLFQAGLGLLVFPAESFVYASYLLALFFAVALARHAQRHSPWLLVQAVLAGIVIAALISAGLALYQRLGLTWLGLMAPDPAWGRATANLGQPNNLSTLLCLGLAGLWWGFLRRHVGPAVGLLAAVLLLLGIVLTGSRTGLLALLVFPLAMAFGWRAVGGTARAWAMLLLAAWLLVVWTVLTFFPPEFLMSGGRNAVEQASGGYRPLMWSHMLDAIAQKPWTGWGWNQILMARTEMASLHPDDKVIFSYAHNLVLDLVMWNGVPLGLTIVFLSGWWLIVSIRQAVDAEHWVLLAALAVLGTHALLEFPHAYLFFLLPAAVFVGALDGDLGSVLRLRVRWGWMLSGLAAAFVLLVVIFRDYQEIERVEVSWQLYEANIGRTGSLPKAASPIILRGLADADEQLRKRPRADMPAAELSRWREALTRYPAAGGLARYAQAASMNGQPREAEWALKMLCQFGSDSLCAQAKNEWLAWTAQHTPYKPPSGN